MELSLQKSYLVTRALVLELVTNRKGRGLRESTAAFFSVVDYFLLNFQEFKACRGQKFVLLWQSRRPKGRKQELCIHTYLCKILVAHWALPIHYSSSRAIFMVQIQTDQPVYGAPFEMPSQVFRGDSFKALILNQKAGESTFHRLWVCLQSVNILSQFLFPTKNKTLPPLCPFAASWLSRLLQRIFAWESVRSWSVMSSAHCHSQAQCRAG